MNKIIIIEDGFSVHDVAVSFKKQNLITSSVYFELLLRTQFRSKYIQASSYIFPFKLNATELAMAITQGTYKKPPIRLTFPEGLHGTDMIERIKDVLPALAGTLNAEKFDSNIGYLFPDTYFVNTDITQDEIISLLLDSYTAKTNYLAEDIANSALTEKEIIILASIVEREANTPKSMKIVAGILRNRLSIGMALQADATLEYILEKGSADLSIEDLATDSPYNTYTNSGLPPTPISNPGLQAIEAVLHPIFTENLYYLTAADGTFYYAETFERHKKNKVLYLK